MRNVKSKDRLELFNDSKSGMFVCLYSCDWMSMMLFEDISKLAGSDFFNMTWFWFGK